MASRRMSSNLIKLLKNGQIHDNTSLGVLSINFDSHVAEVEYEKKGGVYDLVHTRIPEGLQGQGLGTIFAERIFDYLAGKDKKFKLTCDFLIHFYALNKNKYKEFVIEN